MSEVSRTFLAMLALCLSVTGCKLAVVVGEGGTVKSQSGTRDCPELSTCAFEVSDTNFSDTFTPVPLPGYKFERWQAGPAYLCWQSKEVSCAISTAPLKEIPALQPFIDSDAVVRIRPVFSATEGLELMATKTDQLEATKADRLVAKDAEGKVLGDVMNIDKGTHASVRQVFVDQDGSQHGYLVDMTRMVISDVYGYNVYWLNTSCSGNQVYVLLPAALEPLFSNRYLVARKDKQQTDKLLLLRLDPPDQAKPRENTYAMENGVCKQITTLLPLVPASIQEADYRSRYTPPFGVHPSE